MASGCSSVFENQNNIIFDSSTGKLSAKANVGLGYSYSLCYQCLINEPGGRTITKTKDRLLIKQRPNTAPYYASPVKSTIEVDLIEGADGEIEDTSTLSYTSPEAKDKDGDKIKMKFEGETEAIKIT